MESFTKWDKLIFISLLIICVISGLYVYIIQNTGNTNEKVVINVQGKIINEIPLIKDGKSKIYKFAFNGNNGSIEIKNGSVRMLKMDEKLCPKGICSATGWISKKYQVIVCLPNKIEVNILSTKGGETIDTIS